VVLLPALALTAVVDGVGRHLFGDRSIYVGDAAYHGTVPENLDAHTTAWSALGTALFVNTNLVPTFGTNGSLWSLAYEASYYAILPLALCTWRYRRSLTGLANAAGLAVVCVIGGLDVLMYLPVWLLGALVAWQRDRIADRLRRLSPVVLRAVRWIAALATAAALGGTGLGYSVAAVGSLTVATTVLLALLVEDVRWTGLPGRAVNSVSRYASASYSLYAIHLPLVVLIQAFLVEDPELRWGPTVAHWIGLGAIVTVLMVAGWGFARLTEHHTERVRRVVAGRLIPDRTTAPTG
jgi:peptidoglycan/LPS O-acetylase OafA/YrhL